MNGHLFRRLDSKPHFVTPNLNHNDGDIVVDIASGHGGGFMPWLTPRLGDTVLLVATDACLPVIENWYKYISGIRNNYAFLDVDLLKCLSFQDDSVDVFTGIGIAISTIIWITVGGFAVLSTTALVVILVAAIVIPLAVTWGLRLKAKRAVRKSA